MGWLAGWLPGSLLILLDFSWLYLHCLLARDHHEFCYEGDDDDDEELIADERIMHTQKIYKTNIYPNSE